MGAEERDADSHVRLHLPPPYRRPWHQQPAASASERGGLLYQYDKGEGERAGGGPGGWDLGLVLVLILPPLSSQFMECLIIGRDLVRLLQNVARIPEMELIWKDLLHNPQVLSPQFTGDALLPTILQRVLGLTLMVV